jgi:electron transport complex protein RnfD
MQLIEKRYNPFIHAKDSTRKVMLDVIIALSPCIIMAGVAYGWAPIMVIVVSVASALFAEALFSLIFYRNIQSLGNLSSVVTGILLAFTIGPFTPLPVVALGAAIAVIFGKMLWGGIGRNRFNPALTGREFMTALFPSIMTSMAIWKNVDLLQVSKISLFHHRLFDKLIFWPNGAIGEYAPFLLILGGLYLLWRRRISWHIPVAMLLVVTFMMPVFRVYQVGFTIGGILLAAIYMATDMPTSSSTPAGKIYFGAMIGVCITICLLMGVQRPYSSYSILLMNAFVVPINWVFRQLSWGKTIELKTRLWQVILLTVAIIATMFFVLWLDHIEAMLYLLIAFAIYSIVRFACSKDGIPWKRMKTNGKNQE